MPWLLSILYDRLIQASEDACLRNWRAELLASASGAVLEVGAGTGLNLSHYPSQVTRLVLSEPDQNMRHRLEKKVGSTIVRKTEISDASLNQLLVPDNSFDVVVATLVLCSVPDVQVALGEVRRVLRPGGSFLFIEHVAADAGSKVFKWQRRIEPFWKRISGNCHLTRRTEEAITKAGLVIRDIKREPLEKTMPLVRPSIRGRAQKA